MVVVVVAGLGTAGFSVAVLADCVAPVFEVTRTLVVVGFAAAPAPVTRDSAGLVVLGTILVVVVGVVDLILAEVTRGVAEVTCGEASLGAGLESVGEMPFMALLTGVADFGSDAASADGLAIVLVTGSFSVTLAVLVVGGSDDAAVLLISDSISGTTSGIGSTSFFTSCSTDLSSC